MTTHLGFYQTVGKRTHVRLQFPTFAAAGGNVAPSSAIDAADIRIYKALDGAAFSATQRSSTAGFTITSPFDSLVGFHDLDIDLTENTDAGFYVEGLYSIVLAPDDETIDSQTITGVVLGYFEITAAPWFGIVDSGTAQSATATTLVLRSAAAFANDTLIGMTLAAFGSTQGYWQTRVITDNTLSDDTVTVDTWTVTPSGTITYAVYATPPSSTSLPPAVNLTQIAGATVSTTTAQLGVNVVKMNTATVQGDGTSGDKWRG